MSGPGLSTSLVITYSYDLHGHLVNQLTSQKLDPNAAGNRIGSTDFRGGTTSMTVDGDNRCQCLCRLSVVETG